MVRGRRPDDDPLPEGVRQDTRKHTRHFLRPTSDMVEAYLAHPNQTSWEKFKKEYQRILEERFRKNRRDFDHLAELAAKEDVFLGCSCPTKTNPDVRHCHTVLALQFMRTKYSDLEVVMPDGP